jgi:regulator of sigma E protease
VTLINNLWPLIVTLGVLIFVHELGHFLAAKWSGIRVHRFALGMGNPIPGLSFRRGNTEYAICWLPLGGYVKMASQEEGATSSALEGSDQDGRPEGAPPVSPGEYFEAKPVWKRMIVILAGVTMNSLLAWFTFTTLAYRNGEQIDPVTTIGGVATDSLPPGAEGLATLRPGDRILAINGHPVVSWNEVEELMEGAPEDSLVISLADGRSVVVHVHPSALTDRVRAAFALAPFHQPVADLVEPGRPAARAGVAIGDTVVAVDNVPLMQWDGLVRQIRASAGTPMRWTVGRAGGRLDLVVTPDSTREGDQVVGKVGVAFRAAVKFERKPYGFGGALVAGLHATGQASTQIVRTVHGLLSARISSREVGGPILIGQMAARSAQMGAGQFFAFMALVSVNLAVLNLLPVPILDGGQFLFLLAEAIRRRPLSLRLRERLTLVGLILIVMLMVLAFKNDIARNWETIAGWFRPPAGQ